MASPPPPPAEDPTPADIWHTSKVMKGSISLQLRQQKQMFFSGSAAGIHKPKFCWLCHFGAGSNPRIHETTRWDEQPGDMLSFLHFTAKKLSDIVYEKNIQQGLLGGESRVVILNFSHSLISQWTKKIRKVFTAEAGTRTELFMLNTLFSALKTISSYTFALWIVLPGIYSYRMA